LIDKIYVDAAQPATLNDGAGKLTDYSTVQEAVMAWHRLRPEQTKRATIKVFGGPVYIQRTTRVQRFKAELAAFEEAGSKGAL
jgi:hypothetical protein